VEDDPTHDQWAFFVRNWGDEGFCAGHQEYFYPPGRKVQVLLRHADGEKVIVGQNVWVYGDNSDDFNQQSWGYQPTNDGLLLTFNLQDPSRQDGFVGDLDLNWTGIVPPPPPNGGHPKEPQIRPKVASVVSESKGKDVDAELREKYLKLDPVAQKELIARIQAMDHHTPSQKKVGALITSSPAPLTNPSGPGPKYGYLKAAEDTVGNNRRTRHREAAIAYLKAHGLN
jgi:hypothetical protein